MRTAFTDSPRRTGRVRFRAAMENVLATLAA